MKYLTKLKYGFKQLSLLVELILEHILHYQFMLISDQYCHDRWDNYIIIPRYVVPRNSEGVLLASALKSRLKEFLQHLQMVLLLFSLALFFQSVKG